MLSCHAIALWFYKSIWTFCLISCLGRLCFITATEKVIKTRFFYNFTFQKSWKNILFHSAKQGIYHMKIYLPESIYSYFLIICFEKINFLFCKLFFTLSPSWSAHGLFLISHLFSPISERIYWYPHPAPRLLSSLGPQLYGGLDASSLTDSRPHSFLLYLCWGTSDQLVYAA